jgi:hypothetical protein
MARSFMQCLVLAAGLFVCAQGYGQTMFRCGNKYQDRPCDAGQKGKVVGSTGVGAASAAASGDAQCAQRGKDALKIVWSREGGATQERLESEASSGQQRRFVRDVYSRRGSASQVQAAVEADCVVEKQKEAEANALAIAAAKARGDVSEMRGEPAGGSPSIGMSQPAPDPAAAERAKQERDAERKKRTCASLNDSMESLTARERRGGSAGVMDAMRGERRSLQSQLSKNSC